MNSNNEEEGYPFEIGSFVALYNCPTVFRVENYHCGNVVCSYYSEKHQMNRSSHFSLGELYQVDFEDILKGQVK